MVSHRIKEGEICRLNGLTPRLIYDRTAYTHREKIHSGKNILMECFLLETENNEWHDFSLNALTVITVNHTTIYLLPSKWNHT